MKCVIVYYVMLSILWIMSFDMDLESVLKATVLEALLGELNISFQVGSEYNILRLKFVNTIYRKSNMPSEQTSKFRRYRSF